MIKYIALLLVLIQTNVNANAQIQNKKIDTLLNTYSKLHKFSGSVLISKAGKTVFEKSYGAANREFNIPNDKHTRFRIASITKQFTAVLIMQLVEAGKLNLHAPISSYLPYYKKDIADSITIHQLLSHTAGLAEYTERDDFFTSISKNAYTHKDFIQKFCSDTLISKPGTAYKYSNNGYYLLGAIIEEITQQPYAEVLQKNILDVAKMKNTGMEAASVIIPKKAAGYNFISGKYLNADYIDIHSTIFSAGAMYSTANDLLLWDKALFSNKLISKKSRDIMFTPVLANYGYGVGIVKFFSAEAGKQMHFIFHQGAINGFRSIITHIVNEDVLIILLCNNFDTDLNQINNAIFSILQNQPVTMPKE